MQNVSLPHCKHLIEPHCFQIVCNILIFLKIFSGIFSSVYRNVKLLCKMLKLSGAIRCLRKHHVFLAVNMFDNFSWNKWSKLCVSGWSVCMHDGIARIRILKPQRQGPPPTRERMGKPRMVVPRYSPLAGRVQITFSKYGMPLKVTNHGLSWLLTCCTQDQGWVRLPAFLSVSIKIKL